MNADDERDAWLREALRHAPDAQLGAPAPVSERILRAAQASANRPPAPSTGATLWAWLARPQLAAGLASVMVATLAGLMWWDRPDEPVLSRPSAVPTGRVAPAASVAVSPPSPAAPIATRPQPLPAAPAAAPTARRKSVAAAADAAAPPPAPSPAPAPAPAAEAAPAATVTGSLPATTLAERHAKAETADSARAMPAPQRSVLGETASLRQSLAAEPERWSWQRGSGAAHSLDERMTAWVAQLDAATATHWQRSPAASPRDSADALRLLRDGRLMHSLRIARGTVRWESAGAGVPSTREAPIGEAAAQALQAALDEATR